MFDRVGYAGTVGLELQPTKPSTEAFAYIQGLCG
jgi:hydroxypyruvate isomerase